MNATLPAASSPCKARVGAGLPPATTVKAMATNAVAPYDVPLVKVGAKATSTTVTLTACVAVPATLLAVKVNVRTPTSPASGV